MEKSKCRFDSELAMQKFALKFMALQSEEKALDFVKGLNLDKEELELVADYLVIPKLSERLAKSKTFSAKEYERVLKLLVDAGPMALLKHPESLSHESIVVADAAYLKNRPVVPDSTLNRIIRSAVKLRKRSRITKYLDVFHFSRDELRRMVHLVDENAPDYIDSTYRVAQFLKIWSKRG